MTELEALRAAETQARLFVGATTPNPPVGSAALDRDGNLLSLHAHERAGTPHAEARVLADCEARGLLSKVQTLVVTLEPCNHFGRTPPCAEAIVRAGVKRVIFAERDPNPVASGGADYLRAAGVEVIESSIPETRELIAPFRKRVQQGLPWVTVKTAHDEKGSMIPPAGQKTFTSEESLRLAHELRKRADAILTGSGTVLADHPEFTVRRVPDHQGKKRVIVVLDRRGRVPMEWIREREAAGFDVWIRPDFPKALQELARKGCLEVLVEAGPEVTRAVLDSGLWDRHYEIRRNGSGGRDEVRVHERSGG